MNTLIKYTTIMIMMNLKPMTDGKYRLNKQKK
jgi:hypothetical protein